MVIFSNDGRNCDKFGETVNIGTVIETGRLDEIVRRENKVGVIEDDNKYVRTIWEICNYYHVPFTIYNKEKDDFLSPTDEQIDWYNLHANL